jgi:hypothetical protein
MIDNVLLEKWTIWFMSCFHDAFCTFRLRMPGVFIFILLARAKLESYTKIKKNKKFNDINPPIFLKYFLFKNNIFLFFKIYF